MWLLIRRGIEMLRAIEFRGSPGLRDLVVNGGGEYRIHELSQRFEKDWMDGRMYSQRFESAFVGFIELNSWEKSFASFCQGQCAKPINGYKEGRRGFGKLPACFETRMAFIKRR